MDGYIIKNCICLITFLYTLINFVVKKDPYYGTLAVISTIILMK